MNFSRQGSESFSIIGQEIKLTNHKVKMLKSVLYFGNTLMLIRKN